MLDNIDVDEGKLPFNPILNETVVEFLSRQRIADEVDPDKEYECRRCGDCCKWNYYKLDTGQKLVDQLYMIGPKRPHGYWVLMDALHCYMPVKPGTEESTMFHFEGRIPDTHVDFCRRTERMWGYWVLDDDDKVVIYCPISCQHLSEDNLCTIYLERPEVCRKYLCGRYPGSPYISGGLPVE